MATRTLTSRAGSEDDDSVDSIYELYSKAADLLVLCQCIFPETRWFYHGRIIFWLGIGVGILISFLYKGTLFKGEPVPFVMELPNYRLPGAKNVTQLLWEKAKDFLQRAFSVIFIATIVVWFLQSFDLHMNMVTDSADSILAAVAGVLVPVFRPLGMGDWRICTSLISGFIAKESVVSTLEVLFAGSIGTVQSTTPQQPLTGIRPACIRPVWQPLRRSSGNLEQNGPSVW